MSLTQSFTSRKCCLSVWLRGSANLANSNFEHSLKTVLLYSMSELFPYLAMQRSAIGTMLWIRRSTSSSPTRCDRGSMQGREAATMLCNAVICSFDAVSSRHFRPRNTYTVYMWTAYLPSEVPGWPVAPLSTCWMISRAEKRVQSLGPPAQGWCPVRWPVRPFGPVPAGWS